MFHRIVCPTDFSAAAHRAAEYAAGLARACGAELVLVHVVPEPAYPMRSLGSLTAFPDLEAEIHARAAREIEEVKGRLDPAVAIAIEVRDGIVHEQILACAGERKADLVVIGTHGTTGLAHLLLGSVAEKVVRTSRCPVLTVRTS